MAKILLSDPLAAIDNSVSLPIPLVPTAIRLPILSSAPLSATTSSPRSPTKSNRLVLDCINKPHPISEGAVWDNRHIG